MQVDDYTATIEAVAGATELERHRVIMSKAMEQLDTDSRVLGVWLAGSFGRGTPKRYSDVDLCLLAEESYFADFFSQRHALALSLGNTLIRYNQTYSWIAPGQPSLVCLYDDLLRVTLFYFAPSNLMPSPHFYHITILLDREGYVAGLQRSSQDHYPSDNSRMEISILSPRFWIGIQIVLDLVRSGHFWAAADTLAMLRHNLMYAFRVLRQDPRRHIWRGYPKGLEQLLDSDYERRFRETIAMPERKDVLRATRVMVSLFVSLRREADAATVKLAEKAIVACLNGMLVEEGIEPYELTGHRMSESVST